LSVLARQLILLRHGQTPANAAGTVDLGVPGQQLTEQGCARARSVARELLRLPGATGGSLHTSDLTRAKETADNVAPILGRDVVQDRRLRELDVFGPTAEDGQVETFLDVERDWASGRLARCLPGGEDGFAFLQRFDGAIAGLLATQEAVGVLVSHGGAIRTWLAHRCSGLSGNQACALPLQNCGYVLVKGGHSHWELESWHACPSSAANATTGDVAKH